MENERIGEATTVIKELLNLQWDVCASWGKHNERPIPLPSDEDQEKTVDRGGLEFDVNGYKFKGTVRVVYEEIPDLFRVEFIKEGKVEDTMKRVFGEDLVNVIDNYVEFTGEDYEDRVRESYPNLTNFLWGEKKKNNK